jgi:transposase
MPVRPVGRDKRPWNKGLLIGQKKPLEPKHVWSIRVRLEIGRSWRDLVIFNLAIDSKLRASDLVKWRHLIENFFGKLKEFKRIAMRADKTNQSFASMIHLAATVINSR